MVSYVRRGLGSEDGKEAVRAIFEKRTPTFRPLRPRYTCCLRAGRKE